MRQTALFSHFYWTKLLLNFFSRKNPFTLIFMFLVVYVIIPLLIDITPNSCLMLLHPFSLAIHLIIKATKCLTYPQILCLFLKMWSSVNPYFSSPLLIHNSLLLLCSLKGCCHFLPLVFLNFLLFLSPQQQPSISQGNSWTRHFLPFFFSNWIKGLHRFWLRSLSWQKKIY